MDKGKKVPGKAPVPVKKGAETGGSKGVRFGIRFKLSLAIIVLVTMIIVSFTGYFIIRESNLLKEQIFQFVKRELVHLSNTVQETLGVEEIAIVNAVKDLENSFKYINYTFILGKKDTLKKNADPKDHSIIQFFDRTKKHDLGKQLDDKIDRELTGPGKEDEIKVIDYPDPNDNSGIIYDFSKPVIGKFNKNVQLGMVIIGISDIIIRNEIQETINYIIPLSLGILILSIIGSVILAGVIIKPIKVLSHGAAVIGQGDLDHKINVNSRDELGQLAREFNFMTAMIKDAKNKEIESRLMEEQLEMAKDIQEGLNPIAFYNKKGIQIKGFTKAAKGVGGDYFDYHDIDDDKICALISDVSGKGVPASLVMVMIRTVFTTYLTRKDIDCAKVVTAINTSLSADFAIDKFATLFFFIYDRKTEELSFSNAGHGPLFCYRASLNACTNTKLDGVPIGITEDAVYIQGKVKLNPGDIVILYTDGVTEMRNASREEFGIKRVKKFMIENSNLNAKDFAELLIKTIDDFRGDTPPHDDETLLVFKRET